VPNIKELKDKILHEAHESAYSIHPGENKMYHDLKATYWWCGMKSDVAFQFCLSSLDRWSDQKGELDSRRHAESLCSAIRKKLG
jgi:hypothetical protein